MQRRILVAVAAALIATAAAGVRIVPPWAEVVEQSTALVRDPDAAYHLRRAEVMASAAPTLAVRDPFINYPAGGLVIWPPAWDLTLAAATRVAPAIASAPGVSIPVALLPPLLAATTALIVFCLARRLWPTSPWRWGLAALAPALLPADLPYTRLAQLDHHALELTLLAGYTLVLARALDAPSRSPLAAGVTLGVALLTQLTLVLLIPLTGFAAIAAAGDRRELARVVAWIFGIAALLVAPFSIPYVRAGATVAHSQFGLFQPLLLTIAGAAAAALAIDRATRRQRTLAVALWVGAASGALLLAPEIVAGAGFVGRTDSLWIARIGESRSALAGGLGEFLSETARLLSPLSWLTPWALWVAWRRARTGDAAAAVLTAALLVCLPLALAQVRFMPHLAVFVGLSSVCVFSALSERMPGKRRGTIVTATSVVALAALIPTLNGHPGTESAALAFERARPVLDHLRDSTPSVYSVGEPGPEYGVLADWSWGHFIQYYARRPAVIDNFGSHAGDLDPPRRILLAADAAAATAELDRLRVRYALIGDLPSTFAGLVPTPDDVDRFIASGRIDGDQASIRYRPAMLATVLYRAAWQNGGGVLDPSSGRYIAPLERWRLVAESSERETVAGQRSVAWIKLYEIVPGATLRWFGRRPGEVLGFVAQVAAPSGIDSPYLTSARVGPDGTAVLTVPYPTESTPDGGWFRSARVQTDLGVEPIPRISLAAVRRGDSLNASAR